MIVAVAVQEMVVTLLLLEEVAAVATLGQARVVQTRMGVALVGLVELAEALEEAVELVEVLVDLEGLVEVVQLQAALEGLAQQQAEHLLAQALEA